MELEVGGVLAGPREVRSLGALDEASVELAESRIAVIAEGKGRGMDAGIKGSL